MKTIYINRKSQKQSPTVRQALEQYRTLRRQFETDHPGFLEKIRENLSRPAQENPENRLKIDKRKNLETVLHLLGARTASADFKHKIGALLADAGKSPPG